MANVELSKTIEVMTSTIPIKRMIGRETSEISIHV